MQKLVWLILKTNLCYAIKKKEIAAEHWKRAKIVEKRIILQWDMQENIFCTYHFKRRNFEKKITLEETSIRLSETK